MIACLFIIIGSPIPAHAVDPITLHKEISCAAALSGAPLGSQLTGDEAVAHVRAIDLSAERVNTVGRSLRDPDQPAVVVRFEGDQIGAFLDHARVETDRLAARVHARRSMTDAKLRRGLVDSARVFSIGFTLAGIGTFAISVLREDPSLWALGCAWVGLATYVYLAIQRLYHEGYLSTVDFDATNIRAALETLNTVQLANAEHARAHLESKVYFPRGALASLGHFNANDLAQIIDANRWWKCTPMKSPLFERITLELIYLRVPERPSPSLTLIAFPN